jgi:hypothetical protein
MPVQVAPCPLRERHDWSACPYAHRGERAARRCPQTCNYSAQPCPEYNKVGNHEVGWVACDCKHGCLWLTSNSSGGGGCSRQWRVLHGADVVHTAQGVCAPLLVCRKGFVLEVKPALWLILFLKAGFIQAGKRGTSSCTVQSCQSTAYTCSCCSSCSCVHTPCLCTVNPHLSLPSERIACYQDELHSMACHCNANTHTCCGTDTHTLSHTHTHSLCHTHNVTHAPCILELPDSTPACLPGAGSELNSAASAPAAIVASVSLPMMLLSCGL